MGNVLTDKRGERFVDTTTRSDGKDALVVDVGGEIQIGAVEIKDSISNDRANVVLRGDGNYALAVDINGGPIAKTDVLSFQSKSIASSATDSLSSITISASKKGYLSQILLSGGNGIFYIKIDGNLKFIYRTSGSKNSGVIDGKDLQLSAGQIISVECENIYHRSNTFDSTIQIYEVAL